MIYFIQSGSSEFVKIGFCSGNPDRRLATLQCGNPEPLKLIAIRDGGLEDESYWHEKFAHLRVRGEWFRWCDEIREYALPLLDDPDWKRKVREQYVRDLVAGRRSPDEIYQEMFPPQRWSPQRRAAQIAKASSPTPPRSNP